MKGLLLILLCATSATAVGQQVTPDYVKEWRFPLQRGEGRARLYRGAGDALTLTLKGPPCYQCASNAELAGMLEGVLRGFVALGLNTERLRMIEMHIEDPAVTLRLAGAAAHSAEWERCDRTRGCGGNGLVVEFLNGTGTFYPIYRVLQEHHLSARVGSAENISVVRASQVAGLALPQETRKTLKVPTDADLELHVQPLEQSSAQDAKKIR